VPQFHIRLPTELGEALREQADKEHRSITNFVARVVQLYLESIKDSVKRDA
jgi:predicted HicB family RNase H-like nuclease